MSQNSIFRGTTTNRREDRENLKKKTKMCFLLNVLEENSKKSQNIELVQPYQTWFLAYKNIPSYS